MLPATLPLKSRCAMDTNASESLLSLDHQDDYNAYEESGEEQVSGLQLQDRQGLPAHQIASASGVNNQPCLTDLYEVLFKLLIVDRHIRERHYHEQLKQARSTPSDAFQFAYDGSQSGPKHVSSGCADASGGAQASLQSGLAMANKPFTPTTAAASGLVHMVLPGTSSGPSAEDRCVYPGCSQNKKTAPTTPAPLPTWQGSKGQTSPQNCLHHEQPGMSGMPAHGQHAQSCSTIDAQEHAVGRPGEAAAGRSLEAGTGSASTPQQAAHIAAQHGNSVSSTSCHTHLVQASTTPAAHAPSVTAAALRGSLDRSGSGRGLSAGMCFEDAGTARTAPPAKRPKR